MHAEHFEGPSHELLLGTQRLGNARLKEKGMRGEDELAVQESAGRPLGVAEAIDDLREACGGRGDEGVRRSLLPRGEGRRGRLAAEAAQEHSKTTELT